MPSKKNMFYFAVWTNLTSVFIKVLHNDDEKNDVQMLLTSFKGTKELSCSSSSSLSVNL